MDVGESKLGLKGRLSGLIGREKLIELRFGFRPSAMSSRDVLIEAGLEVRRVSTLEKRPPLVGVGLTTRAGGSVLEGRRNDRFVINDGAGDIARGRSGTGGAFGSAGTL